ncbi:hypothetical protein ACN2XU_17020 [Primorskyibacter sp. 2E107]|uniref:hypothetical protein n=1 Tax=Primorskyibacter sp. 2E107 TaxID=3403458 RepID=UPI003AF89CE0
MVRQAKPYRKSFDEMEKERGWTRAERLLLELAQTGFAFISDEKPEACTDDTEIRADLIRHITLGGCKRCRVPDKGVLVMNAFISGQLDLQGCDTPLNLWLDGCHFAQTPVLMDARLGAVLLPGCTLPGLVAHRLRVARSVLLNKGFKATGPVNLSGARIDGTLDCDGGSFDGNGGTALNANAVTIGADLFLRGAFTAKGEVNLRGATITGQVDCEDGTFDGNGGTALNANAITIGADLFLRSDFTAKGTVNLVGATITGQVSCIRGTFDGNGGTALNANAITIGASLFLSSDFTAKGEVNLIRAEIAGNLYSYDGSFDGGFLCAAARIGAGFFWTRVKTITGPLDLTDAHVGRLHDDQGSYAGADPLILNGFRYDRLTGDLTIQQRLDWLGRKQDRPIAAKLSHQITIDGEDYDSPMPYYRGDFGTICEPQPYTQLAKVLREQGRSAAAARVLEARDRCVSRAMLRRAMADIDHSPGADWRGFVGIMTRLKDILFGLVFGYGHRPGRALLWVALIIGLNWALYAQVWNTGQMAPNSDIVLTSEDWTDAVKAFDAGQGPLPQIAWSDKAKAAKDYTTFSAPLYALDLFIPLDALGQEAAWSPSPVRGLWGKIGFWTGWLTQLSGWVITAIGAAAVAGLVGRKE